ncbi:hypothetical protein FisN_9Lu127 [Fistulifera solaris]|uniref:Uncharacterized protein n=1 Tax=Fistulifera solaris TaxID=1519565 RepID=A0A1Z5KKY0_FISSO|nr:hypothetical protein FisN_9Lu127 [Fistulifera solaris]|eukprot:GAX26847.1 hypothetical protein FisN_9Lu127 [Fistulifera solaris]
MEKRRQTIRPFRKLLAAFRSRHDAEDDVVAFDREAAAPESVPRNPYRIIVWDIDNSRPCGEELLSEAPEYDYLAAEGCPGVAAVPGRQALCFACDYDAALDDFFSPPTRRVTFAQHVTVVPIQSHQSLTEDEKRFLYGVKSTKKEKSLKEQQYEDSKHCIENALEEEMFYPNHEGKLVHPAHFRSFVREILPTLPRDMKVPGFLSFEEYYGVLEFYARKYNTSIAEELIQDDPVEV